jgi:hypothetical protein
VELYEKPAAAEGDPPFMETARMAMAVHYTHIALVILVMDLCFNRDEEDHEERKWEVFAALQMLDGARSLSPLLSRCLDSVVEVLRKHDIHLSLEYRMNHDVTGTTQHTGEGNTNVFDNTPVHFPQEGLGSAEGTFAIDPVINEFWQNANLFDTGLDSSGWDMLFSNLDSRPF